MQCSKGEDVLADEGAAVPGHIYYMWNPIIE